MDRYLEARPVGRLDHRLEFALLPVQDAAVIRIGGIRFAGCTRRPARGSIRHDLVRADAKSVIAESRVNAALHQRRTGAVAEAVRAKRVDTQAQLSLVVDVLDLHETRTDDPARVVDRGTARFEVRFLRRQDVRTHFRRRKRCRALQRPLRGFIAHAEVAAAFPVVPPTGWIRRRIRDPRHLKRHRIPHGNMPARAREYHRMIWRDGVEIEAVGVPLFRNARLVVSPPADPCSRWLGRRSLPDFFGEGANRTHARCLTVDRAERPPESADVAMRIDEPRCQAAPVQIDNARSRSRQRAHLCITPNSHDALAVDRDRFYDRIVCIDRMDPAVDENQRCLGHD